MRERSRCSNAFCSLLSGNDTSPFFFTAPSVFLNNMVCGNSMISRLPFPVIWLHRCHVTAPIALLYCNRLHIFISAATECLSLLTEQLLGSNFSKTAEPTQTSASASAVGPPVQLALNWREQYNTAPHQILCGGQRDLFLIVPHACILEQKLPEGLSLLVNPVVTAC